MGNPTQDAWLKELGINVEASRASAGHASTAPSLNVSARSGQGPKAPYTYQAAEASAAKPGTQYKEYEEPSDEAEPAAPPLGNYSVDPSARPDLKVPEAKPAQGTPTRYKEYEEPVAEAEPAAPTFGNYGVDPSARPDLMVPEAKPAQGTPTVYKEYEEPVAEASATGSSYSAPMRRDDDSDDDSGDENDATEGPYGQATEASGDEAGAAEQAAAGGADDVEVEPQTPAETGMKSLRVDAKKYEGEHNKAGWRKDIWKVDGEDTRITTKLYSEEEQAANRLVQKAGGKFKLGDGQATDNLKRGFAMDETGRMVAFKEDRREKITLDDYDDEEKREDTTDHPTKVVKDDPNARVEITHHSTVLGGETVLDDGKPVLDAEGRPMMRSKPAALAGDVEFNNAGQIKNITNKSGHYKPTVDYLMQGVEHLMKQGAFFEDEVVRMTDEVAKGEKHKPLKDSDPDYKLYKTVQAKLADSKKLGARIHALAEALDKEEDEKKATAIGGQLEKLKGELDALKAYVDKSQKELRGKGVGPSNRLRWDATAQFLEVKKGMTGADVHAAPTTTMHVGEFLSTGGGYENKKLREDDDDDDKDQASLKEKALKDLKADPAPRRFAPNLSGTPEEQDARKKAALEALKKPRPKGKK